MQYKTFSSFYIFNTIGRYTFSKSKAVLLFLRPKDCGSCSSNYENHLEPISFRLKKNMCTINWLDSEYQRHGDTWKPVNVQNTFFYIEKFNNRKKRLRASIDSIDMGL